MFKALIGKGHPEFSTNRQQDAQEFFLHLINMVERNCRSSENPNEVFRFLVEEKIKCLATEKVKYTQRVDYIMQLPVPMDAALNKEELLEYEEKKRQAEEEKLPLPELVRAQVPFSSCLRPTAPPSRWTTSEHGPAGQVSRRQDHTICLIPRLPGHPDQEVHLRLGLGAQETGCVH